MKYLLFSLKRALKSGIVTTILILVLWVGIYNLTDFETVCKYFWTGIAVCALNNLISIIKNRRIENILRVQGFWVVIAGVVLVLYHANFEAAAVFVAATAFASPFFGATVYEGVVGFTLLVTLANLIF